MEIRWKKLNSKSTTSISLEQYLGSCLQESIGGYAFRGQSDHTWQLVPSAFRSAAGGLVDHVEREQRVRYLMSDAFSKQVAELRELVFQREEVKEMAGSSFKLLQLLVIAQHFGIPTPLLDLTRSPLVALFMATAFRPVEDCTVAIFRFETALIPSDHVIWQMYDSVGFRRIESQLGGVFCFGKMESDNITISATTAEEHAAAMPENDYIKRIFVSLKKTDFANVEAILHNNGFSLDRMFPKSSHWFAQTVKQKIPWM